MNAEDQPLDSRLQSMFDTMNLRQKQCDAFFDTLPQQKQCEKHPAVTVHLDRQNSGLNTPPVYPCSECLREAAVKKRIQRLISLEIPEDALHATVDNFQTNRTGINKTHKTPAQFQEAARRFQKGEVRNLILAGTPGIGKGHLAAALAIEAVDSGRHIGWTTCSQLFTDYHEAYKDSSTENVIRWYRDPDLLVLDELCLRDLPADGEEILFSILDGRHKQRLPSILLGNKPADDCRKWLGARITDRLRSGGLAFCYGEWDSMRGTAADGSQFEM